MKVARLLVLLRGDQAAAKTSAEDLARIAGIEDKGEIKKLVDQAKATAPKRSSDFKIQLAALVDGAYSLIFATYAIEGDGVTVFFSWEVWEAARESIKLMATAPETAAASNVGLLFTNIAVWRDHWIAVKAIFSPAWTYFQGQIYKHAHTLKFLEAVNGFCPWNAKSLTEVSLKYLVQINVLRLDEVGSIVENELDLYHFYGPAWEGAPRPTFPEYFLRQSPKNLLPEARVWRFWYVYQLRMPILNLCVRRLSTAQFHSAAAERAGSLFTHDKTSQMDATSVQTAVIRQRGHYQTVINPMQNMPLSDLVILAPL